MITLHQYKTTKNSCKLFFLLISVFRKDSKKFNDYIFFIIFRFLNFFRHFRGNNIQKIGNIRFQVLLEEKRVETCGAYTREQATSPRSGQVAERDLARDAII